MDIVAQKKENSGADHLSALAQISKIIKDEERCEKIREAATGNDIYRLLTSDWFDTAAF